MAETSASAAEEPAYTGPERRGPRQIRSGDQLGRYAIAEELGEGGMATVFRARDRELRRDVALKVLFPHLARKSEIVRRFQREARAAAGLEHANILRIYDVGGAEGDDPPYIVMELVRGRTLAEEIAARGAMLAEVVACIGALLADALAAAHAAGVIHRDVKPANVLIAPGGRILLADFGVARLESEDSLVTRTGALLGTPAYMSPEQSSGEVTTAQSDLYSLGATLYQLATGSLPYAGTPAKIMSQIAAGGAVAPVRRRPACGVELSRLIERMMATEPAARPSDAAAIAGELRALAAAGGFGDASDELTAYFAAPEGFVRARTPAVVAALVEAARAASAAGKLPRAMALADRASALAPDDAAVRALVHRVTAGGETSRRQRALGVAAGALLVLGGGGALAWKLMRAPGTASADAGALVATAPVAPPIAPAPIAAPEAPVDAPAVAVDAAPVVDAGRAVRALRSVDAGVRVALRPIDAAPEAPAVDAHPGVEPSAALPDAAVEARPSYLIVKNDLWCNIAIDGVERGNRRNERLEVAPGHHTVRCVNPAGAWTQDASVAPGETRVLTGATLAAIAVRLEVDAVIDGKPYARGAVVKVKPSNLEVIVGGRKLFITFRASCTLRDTPTVGCYL